jgi:hypothetical protein
MLLKAQLWVRVQVAPQLHDGGALSKQVWQQWWHNWSHVWLSVSSMVKRYRILLRCLAKARQLAQEWMDDAAKNLNRMIEKASGGQA